MATMQSAVMAIDALSKCSFAVVAAFALLTCSCSRYGATMAPHHFIHDSYRPTSAAEIASVSKELSMHIPDAMAQFLLVHNGGTIRPGIVFDCGSRYMRIDNLIGIHPEQDRYCDLSWSIDAMPDLKGLGLLPFGETGIGDVVCVASETGAVYYFDHESAEVSGPLCDSIGELLSSAFRNASMVSSCEADPLFAAIEAQDDERFSEYFNQLSLVERIALNSKGRSPLMFAMNRRNHFAVTSLLLDQPDVNANDGKTGSALHYAVRGHYFDGVTMLIGSGADIEARDEDGRTPLRLAAELGSSRLVRLLILHGADLDYPDSTGLTARRVCLADRALRDLVDK